MPSFYVQDTWNPTSQLAFNLGVAPKPFHRFRTTIKSRGVHVQLRRQDRAAALALPTTSAATAESRRTQAGAATSVGQIRLARGSFGSDVWNIYYRSLDARPASASLSNMPGTNLWPGPFPPTAVCRGFDTIDRN